MNYAILQSIVDFRYPLKLLPFIPRLKFIDVFLNNISLVPISCKWEIISFLFCYKMKLIKLKKNSFYSKLWFFNTFVAVCYLKFAMLLNWLPKAICICNSFSKLSVYCYVKCEIKQVRVYEKIFDLKVFGSYVM